MFCKYVRAVDRVIKGAVFIINKGCHKFYHFIEEQERNDEISELPLKMWHYLELPCRLGHPVSVRFWNELLAYIGTPEARNRRLGEYPVFRILSVLNNILLQCNMANDKQTSHIRLFYSHPT